MFTSFSTALSALTAYSTGVDVVGNNLANLNTTGYKASAVSFHDLVSQSVGAAETQVGFGVGRPITIRQFTQGAIQTSNGPMDLAIQGDGFLIARTQDGNMVYTRGGHLRVNSDGTLLTSTGDRVMGWSSPNGVIDTNSAIDSITVPVGTVRAPTPTRSFSVDLNLNAAAPEGETFSRSIEVFDSLGTSHLATVSFKKSATANEWDYALSIDDNDVESPVTPVTGTITFNQQGLLESPAAEDDAPLLEITGFKSGAADMELSWRLFDGTNPRLTQLAQPSAASANSQDGEPAAQLTQVAIGDGGTIVAQYSNGERTVVGQIAMASIRNPESLVSVGNNNFQLSTLSALPAVGLPGTGGRGTIVGGSIESSTVDIAREFTNLIILQRGYQANAKVVTTVDEMSQETLNLKR